MASLKDLRLRIKSVKSTQKITKAMKMVAASKLRRAREAAEASRAYAERIERMVANLASGQTQNENAPLLLRGTGKDQKVLLVLVSADRGLCGGFNSSIVRAAKRKILQLRTEGKEVGLYVVGKKAGEMLGYEYRPLIDGQLLDVLKRKVEYAHADQIAADILELFETKGYDVVTLVYNQFKSAISQVVTYQQLIPLEVKGSGSGIQDSDQKLSPNAESRMLTAYEYEPDEDAILADLLPRNLTMQIFRALLESAASEQGARMTAMDNASRNAGEMIKKLSLTYNRSRQAQITKELIEIISGAEAV